MNNGDVNFQCTFFFLTIFRHYKKITSLQRAAFAKFPGLRDFALKNVATVDTRKSLEQHFGDLDADALKEIACFLNLVPDDLSPPFDWHRLDKNFLLNLLVSFNLTPLYFFLYSLLIHFQCIFFSLYTQISRHERRVSQLDALNEMPLYPTEAIIWDENLVPNDYFADGCLALPKLNLQFLTLHDYLFRNFNLFRLESTCKLTSL
jgi:intron-binding protein aquarius